MLLRAGTDINVTNDDGATPLDLARDSPEVTQALESKGHGTEVDRYVTGTVIETPYVNGQEHGTG